MARAGLSRHGSSMRCGFFGLLLASLVSSAGAVGAPGTQPGELPPLDLGAITELHLMVPMRDGVRLSAYVYVPGPGRYPLILQQRYNPLTSPAARTGSARFAAHGYVVANVNFRGAQKSEGTWVGYRAMAAGPLQDGYDLCEWLARQPWCDGKVGTTGNSQASIAQNFLAAAAPPHLVAQYMIDTGLSLFHEGYRIGGTTRPDRFKATDLAARVPADNRRLMAAWFRHPDYDDYWREEDASRHFAAMNVPCFTIGSWYDFMCVGAIQSFVGRQHRAGPGSRGQQHLLLGPWIHGGARKPNVVGDLTYPANANFELNEHSLRWFDHYLKGVANGVEREPAVRYYVMGAVGEAGSPGNAWREAEDWPIPATPTPYYLAAGGQLSSRPPLLAASSSRYASDPRHPAQIPGVLFPGASDARDFERQPNVLTFSTHGLEHPVEWTGKVAAELYVGSSAKDTDFIVRISDVYPDGRSILIIDMVRRARYRDGFDHEVFMAKGAVYRVAFDVGWLSQIFNRGHRIRVTVASNGAPFYEVNPNTGAPLTMDFPAETIVAQNQIYHERDHASRIWAPIPKR